MYICKRLKCDFNGAIGRVYYIEIRTVTLRTCLVVALLARLHEHFVTTCSVTNNNTDGEGRYLYAKVDEREGKARQ